MTEHLTKETIDRFRRSRLPSDELLDVSDHMADCKTCASLAGEDMLLQDQTTNFISAVRGREGLPHLTYEQLEEYLDGRLPVAGIRAVDQHIATCGECDAEIEHLRSLASAIENEDANVPAINRKRAPFGWFWAFFPVRATSLAAAAVGVLILTLGSIAVWRGVYRSDRNEMAQQAESNILVNEPGATSVDPPGSLPEANLQANNDPQIGDADLRYPLVDGSRKIGLTSEGKLSGYEDLPADLARTIAEALRTGTVRINGDLAELRTTQGVLMGHDPGSGKATMKLRSPIGEVIMTTTPTFSWDPLEGAENYVVDVFDGSFNKVASSGPLRNTSWSTPQLPRGSTYLWQVTATRGSEQIKAPQRPAPDAKFKIASRQSMNRIAQVKRLYPGHSLALGIAYSEAGLIRDALREFDILARSNPDSHVPRRIISSTRDALGSPDRRK